MPATRNYLAFDLGASGGRAMVGRFDGARLTLEETHRFPNGPVALPRRGGGTSLHWNVVGLFEEIKEGLGRAVATCGELTGISLDTWGVDFALLDAEGALLGLPYHYRDSRTAGMLDLAFLRAPRAEIFAATGIQFMQINTLYQLLALAARADPVLGIAQTLLMIPDLLNYWLTGRAVSERTIASTTQFLDPHTGDWARGLLARLDLPTHFLPALISPGVVLGELLPHVAAETAAGRGTRVIAAGCHDTASAVAAVPAVTARQEAGGPGFAYISSGTWSLLGTELSRPVIDTRSLAANVTNEGGVCGTIRLLKNVTGLWIIQECRRAWAAGGQAPSWDEIVSLAAEAPPFSAVIDVDAPEFAAPGDMPARLAACCRRTGQTAPATIGTTARVIYESLALKYRYTLELIEGLLGRRLAPLHIVGGGSRNRLLNQFAADATGRPVVAGPIEATAIGNLLLQMLATGALASLVEGRELVRRSFAVETYIPQPSAGWDAAYDRLRQLLA